jgi:hypothetical protein
LDFEFLFPDERLHFEQKDLNRFGETVAVNREQRGVFLTMSAKSKNGRCNHE